MTLPITATDWAMVKDNVTGLIWENNSHKTSWDNAPAVIASLNTAKFCGYSDWRLPTMTELGSIVDFSVRYPGPTINTSYFKDTFVSFYWTSSTYAYYIDCAWGVFFYFGDDYNGNYKNHAYYVRAVRAGQSIIRSFDPLVINGDRIVSDNTTGLMWQQDTAKTATGATTMVWKDALSYCENLTLGGYTDWRLPTVKELRSIVDYTVYSPAIDIGVFKDTFSNFYWSSSIDAKDIGLAWGVLFYYGYVNGYGKNGSYYVRAVRVGQSDMGLFGTLVILPTSRSVANSSGTTTFAVSNTDTSPSTMAWSAAVTSGGDWLSITSGSSGSNSGTITCSYSANTTTSARTGTIKVTATGAAGSPQDLTVVQNAGGSKPTVQTGAASAVTTNSATLNGTINPNGLSTTYYFEYGTTTNYGSKTPGADGGSGTTIKTVSANITGLTANTTYHFHLVGINAAGDVPGGDQTFTTIGQQAGSLTVTISPATAVTAGAQWQLDNTGVWNSSGANVSSLSVGTHTVSFKDVSGWTTPANQTVNITNGQTATATGTYTQTQQFGHLTVTISPAAAVTAGAQWQLDNTGVWNSSGATVSNLTVGTHTVSFKDVTGWTKPANQTVTIENGKTATATGTYIQDSITTPVSPVPDTGITKCYNDTGEIPCPTAGQVYYGQDGNYSINPMSYTKLDGNGSSLPDSATSWAMVKDNVTGLTWENNSHQSTWNDAPNVIAQLNTAKFGGYSDWRLPTMMELATIVDNSITDLGSIINTKYFQNTFLSIYWSDSINASSVTYACGVNFQSGRDELYAHKYKDSYYIRAVRGEQPVLGHFIITQKRHLAYTSL